MKKKLNKFMSLLLAAVFVISTVFTAFADTEMVGVADAGEVVAAEAAEAAEVAEALAPEAAKEAAEEAMLGATTYDVKFSYGGESRVGKLSDFSAGKYTIHRVMDNMGIQRSGGGDDVTAAAFGGTYYSFDKASGNDIGEWKINCGSGAPATDTLTVTVDGTEYKIDFKRCPPEKNQRGDFQIPVNEENRNLAFGEKGTYVAECKNSEYTNVEYSFRIKETPQTGIAKIVSQKENQCVIEAIGKTDGCIDIFCDIFFTDKNGDEWRTTVSNRATIGADIKMGFYLDYGDSEVLNIGETRKIALKVGAYTDYTLDDVTKVEWNDKYIQGFAALSADQTGKDVERTITANKGGSGNLQLMVTYIRQGQKNPSTYPLAVTFRAEEQREDRPPFELSTTEETRNLAKGEIGEYEVIKTDDSVTVKKYEWSIQENYAKGLAKFVSAEDVNPVKVQATGVDGYIDLFCKITYEKKGVTYSANFGCLVTTGKDVEPGPWLDLENYYIPAGGKVTAEIKPGAYICTSADQMVRIEMGSYDKSVIDVKQITKTKYEITGLKAGRAHVYFEVYFDEKNPERRWGIGNGCEVQDVATMLPADTWVPAGTNLEKVGEVRFFTELEKKDGDVELGTVDQAGRIKAYYRNNDQLLIDVPEGCSLYFNEDSSKMFSKFTNLRSVNIHNSRAVVTSKVKKMDEMFAGCSNLRYVDLIFDTHKVTSSTDMFKDCKKLEQLAIQTEWFTLYGSLPSDMTYSCEKTGANEITNLQLADEPKGFYNYIVIGKATEVDKPVDTSEAKSEGTGDASVVIDQITKNKKADVSAEGILSAVKREALAKAAGVKLEDVENIKLSANAKLIGINADKEADKTVAKKLKFEISPVAEIETKTGATMPANVTNGMLNGGKIKVSVPLPDTDRNAVEIVHVSQGMPNETFTVYIDKSQGSGNYFIEFEITHFSTFEMTFVDKHDDPDPVPPYEPSYSSTGSTVLFTGTWNKPVSNGTWKKDANGIWHYATTMTFRNTWGYIVNPYAGEGQNKADWFWFDANGNMLTGWQLINGKWYYLNPVVGSGDYGACFIGPGKTPDGWTVDENGAWVESVPKA